MRPAYIVATLWACGCAALGPAVHVVAAPASQPSSEGVWVPRSELEAIAVAEIEGKLDAALELNQCHGDLRESQDQTKAADARADKLRLATIFGTSGAAVVGAIAAVLVAVFEHSHSGSSAAVKRVASCTTNKSSCQNPPESAIPVEVF